MISLLITTKNRLSTLQSCLQAISNSDSLGDISDAVVIVDDGSTDETPAYLSGLGHLLPPGIVLKILRNSQSRGPAAARNIGVAEIHSPYTFIIGDDTILFPDALLKFCRYARENDLSNTSVIGNIMPIPVDMTAFEWWSCHGGSQFGHSQIPLGQYRGVGEEYFYTSNILVSTMLLKSNPFDESFRHARYEDRELAYRLSRLCGHQVDYLPTAKSYHDHKISFRNWLRNFSLFTESALLFSALYPNDFRLKTKLGILRAAETACFESAALKEAVFLINTHHNTFFNYKNEQEWTWKRAVLGGSFRLIQEFFRMFYYRKQMGLSDISIQDGACGFRGAEFISILLDELAETT